MFLILLAALVNASCFDQIAGNTTTELECLKDLILRYDVLRTYMLNDLSFVPTIAYGDIECTCCQNNYKCISGWWQPLTTSSANFSTIQYYKNSYYLISELFRYYLDIDYPMRMYYELVGYPDITGMFVAIRSAALRYDIYKSAVKTESSYQHILDQLCGFAGATCNQTKIAGVRGSFRRFWTAFSKS